MPSLSSSACASTASAGTLRVPRTNSRPDPLMLDGLKFAGAATQIVARGLDLHGARERAGLEEDDVGARRD